MRNISLVLSVLILCAALGTACSNTAKAGAATPDPEAVTPTVTASFAGDIKPMMDAKCGKCHVQDMKGGLSFQSLDRLMAGGRHGAAINPGNADSSLLYKMASGQPGVKRMPPRGEGLTPTELATLKSWIDSGAK